MGFENPEQFGVQNPLRDRFLLGELAVPVVGDVQFGNADFDAQGREALDGQLHVRRVGAQVVVALHADAVDQLFAVVLGGIFLVELLDHVIDGRSLALVVIIVIVVVQLGLQAQFLDDFPGGQERLFDVLGTDGFVPAGLPQGTPPILGVRRVVVDGLIDHVPGNDLVAEFLAEVPHRFLDVAAQVLQRLFFGKRRAVLVLPQPFRRLLVPDERMSDDVKPFGDRSLDEGVLSGEIKLAVGVVDVFRLHGVLGGDDVEVLFQQLQPDAFKIRRGHRVADPEVVLVHVFDRREVLLDFHGTSVRRDKADVVDVERRFGMVGCFHIDRDELIADARVAVGAFQLDPAVGRGDPFLRDVLIARAGIADLRGQLDFRRFGRNQFDPGGNVVLSAQVDVFLDAQGRTLPVLLAAFHLEGVFAAFGMVRLVGDRQHLDTAAGLETAGRSVFKGHGFEGQRRIPDRLFGFSAPGIRRHDDDVPNVERHRLAGVVGLHANRAVFAGIDRILARQGERLAGDEIRARDPAVAVHVLQPGLRAGGDVRVFVHIAAHRDGVRFAVFETGGGEGDIDAVPVVLPIGDIQRRAVFVAGEHLACHRPDGRTAGLHGLSLPAGKRFMIGNDGILRVVRRFAADHFGILRQRGHEFVRDVVAAQFIIVFAVRVTDLEGVLDAVFPQRFLGGFVEPAVRIGKQHGIFAGNGLDVRVRFRDAGRSGFLGEQLALVRLPHRLVVIGRVVFDAHVGVPGHFAELVFRHAVAAADPVRDDEQDSLHAVLVQHRNYFRQEVRRRVIECEQNRFFRRRHPAFHDGHVLFRRQGGIAVVVQILHLLAEIVDADVGPLVRRRFLDDVVEHDRNVDGRFRFRRRHPSRNDQGCSQKQHHPPLPFA